MAVAVARPAVLHQTIQAVVVLATRDAQQLAPLVLIVDAQTRRIALPIHVIPVAPI